MFEIILFELLGYNESSVWIYNNKKLYLSTLDC